MQKMKNACFRYGILLLLLAVVLPAAAQVVVVQKPKKPAVIAVKKDSPGPDYGWIEGHWRWDKGKQEYVWVPGHWEQKPKGSRYVAGKWKKVPGGYKWIPGTWVAVKKPVRMEKAVNVSDKEVIVVDKIGVEGGVVAQKPVQPKMKVKKGRRPGRDYVWISGHWRWNVQHKKYVWESPKWVREPAGKKWSPGQWKQVPGGYKWIPGKWVKM